MGPNPQQDPHALAFGFGRRICPGKELADASLFMYVAMSVAVLEMRGPVKDGKEVVPRKEWVAGTITCVFSLVLLLLGLSLC